MYEYRIYNLKQSDIDLIEEAELMLIEENFNKELSWLLYGGNEIKDLLDSINACYVTKTIEETGWEERWKEFLQDGWLTSTVYYSYDDKKFADNRQILRINPSLAFGTGGHATTRLAADLSEDVAKGNVVLDIGTGSAILAILASLKGACTVYGCDNDPVCLANGLENILLNKVDNVHLWTGVVEELPPEIKPDVVIANIITSVLKSIHATVTNLNPEFIVYSGILEEELSTFLKELNIVGYKVDKIAGIEEWRAVRLKRI